MVLCQNANSSRPVADQEESHSSNMKRHLMLPKLSKVKMVPTTLEELLLLNTVARKKELQLPPPNLEKSPACLLEILDSTQQKNLLEHFSLMQEKLLPLELLLVKTAAQEASVTLNLQLQPRPKKLWSKMVKKLMAVQSD